MNERDIILTLPKQTGIPENRLFESVLHDLRDNRRFYLTNGPMDIKPTDDTIFRYISSPHIYCEKLRMDCLFNA